MRIHAVEQAEDRLPLRSDPQPVFPELGGELFDRLHADTLSTIVVRWKSPPIRRSAPLCDDRPRGSQSARHGTRSAAKAWTRFQGLADVVLDPWIDQQPMRLYNPEQLAARIEAEGADLLVVESDFVSGPVLDLPLLAIGSCRGDPNKVDVARRHRRRDPGAAGAGRNADAVAEMTVALLFAADPMDRAGRSRRPLRRPVPRRTIPYQRYPAAVQRGKTAGIVGLGAVGRGGEWRLEGLGMRVIAHDPYAEERDRLARRLPSLKPTSSRCT